MLGWRTALFLYAIAVCLFLTGPIGGGLWGVAATSWLYVAGPVLVAAATRGRIREVLHVARPPLRAVLGAILVGASAWLVLIRLILPLQERIAPMPPDLGRTLEALTGSAVPLPLVLFALALTPALCEELLCRGALLFGFRPGLGRVGAVLTSAALFGALHLNPYRFLPTFLLGLAFGTLALGSRSIVPAMVAHFLNNCAVVLAGQPAFAPLMTALDSAPIASTAGAVTLLTIGLTLAVAKE